MRYLLQGRRSRIQLQSLSKFLALQPGNETSVLSVAFSDRLSAWTSGVSSPFAPSLGVGYDSVGVHQIAAHVDLGAGAVLASGAARKVFGDRFHCLRHREMNTAISKLATTSNIAR